MRLRVLYIRPLAFQAQVTYPKGAYGLIIRPLAFQAQVTYPKGAYGLIASPALW